MNSGCNLLIEFGFVFGCMHEWFIENLFQHRKKKKKFRKIAKELLEIKLIANVDCDALARLLIAQDQYIEITQQIRTRK